MAFGYGGKFNGDESVAWKTEGMSDALALSSLHPPDDHAVVTNGCGAQERPAPDNEWFWRRFKGMEVFVVHDCDKPGQRGAIGDPAKQRLGWATAIAKYAKVVRNVVLPYPIEDSKGKDLRDWIDERKAEGKDDATIFAELVEYASQAEVVTFPDYAVDDPADDDDGGDDGGDADQDDDGEAWPEEHPDDPHRLARINLERYEHESGGRLRYWRQQWYKYKNGRYSAISDAELEAKVIGAIRREYIELNREETDRYNEWCESNEYDERIDKGPPKVRKISRSTVSMVIAAMRSSCLLNDSVEMPSWLTDGSQPHIVSMSNGLLDLDVLFDLESDRDAMRPHTPDWFSTVKLDYRFDPEAKCPLWNEYLDFTFDGDTQRIMILQEWAGYLLTQSMSEQKFLVLEGDGGNGKTVYAAGITAMLGQQNVSNVPLENFAGRFDLGTTIGKAVNICGDTNSLDEVAEGQLKQFTGGGLMQFDRKNKEPISVQPTAKLMIAWNTRPRIRDRTNGMWRRMLIVPFLKGVTADRRVKGMDSHDWWIKQGEVPGILWWAVNGLERLRDQGDFTHSDVCEAATRQYREDSNPVLRFMDENLTVLPPAMLAEDEGKELSRRRGVRTDEAYRRYREWCEAEGNRAMSQQNFGRELARQFVRHLPGIKPDEFRHQRRVGGDRFRVYVGIGFLNENGEVEAEF